MTQTTNLDSAIGPEVTRAFAREYISLGISIAPQIPGTKKTFVKWKPFQQRLATHVEIDAWFTRWKNAGIIAILGPVSNLLCIDVDGREAHETLCGRLGALPPAPQVISGKGVPFRYHLFFRHPAIDTINKYTPWHPRLEFRGNKGILVLPPSRHETGNRYYWAPGKSFRDLPIPFLPQAVLDALTERVKNEQVVVKAAAAFHTFVTNPTQSQQLARKYVAKMDPAVQGQGGDKQTFKVACRLTQGFMLSVSDALPVLLEYNSRCVPPWNEQDLVRKLEEAAKRPGQRGNLLRRFANAATSASLAPDAARLAPFSGMVPDYVLADWTRARPLGAAELGRRARPSERGMYWAIHFAAILQRSSRVIMPDRLLGQVVWGGDISSWPRNWRQSILRTLRDVRTFAGRWIDDVRESGRSSCSTNCAMFGAEIRHRHLTIALRFANVDDNLVSDQADLRQIIETQREHSYLGALAAFGHSRPFCDYSRKPPPPLDENCETSARTEEWYQRREERERHKEMMADKKSGRVFAAYLPMLFFGYSRRIGLSKRQVELHKAMTHELTRCRTQSNQRPDKAELVIGGQQQKLPDGNVRTACPYLQPGIRYVGFNGNKGRRRPESFRGRGYRLQTWLHRAKYFDTAAGFDLNSGAEQTRIDNTTCGEHEKIDCKLVKRLFCDLRRLSEVFGLIVCGRHEQRQQWLDLPGLQAQLASQAGRAWLKRCVIRIYTAEDFLVRWRRVLAARMGFAYIPDRGYDEPAKTESQSREYWIGYLRQAKISRKELARGLNVSTALVSLYMSGARPWTKKWRERLETWAAANVNSLPAPS